MRQSSAITDARQPLRPPWWLNPAWLFAAVIGLSLLAAAWQSNDAYLLYGTPKYIKTSHLLLAAGSILAFAIGCGLGKRRGGPVAHVANPPDTVLMRWFYLATALSLFGYAAWLGVGLKNGFGVGVLLDLLLNPEPGTGEHTRDEMFPAIAGVTTCTQFAVAAVPLGVWLALRGVKGVWLPLGVLLTAAFLRALLFNERLALIELVLPGLVVALRVAWLGRPARTWQRWGLAAAPLAGVLGLVAIFGTFEYFRSWRYYEREFSSYTEFTVWRISGYYTTAHNNGAMALETQDPLPLPFSTLRHWWWFPLIDKTPLDYEKLTRVDPHEVKHRMLERYGTPELNNDGGLFQPAIDYGAAGSLVFWFLCGAMTGRFYRSYLSGNVAGIALYPLAFLAILEAPRYLYLTHPRSFPALLFVGMIVLAAHWKLFGAVPRQTPPAPPRVPIGSGS